MSKKKKLVLCVIIAIISISIGSIVKANLNHSEEKPDSEKIAQYLEEKYNEKFDDIELIAKKQNTKYFQIFPFLDIEYKVDNSFTYYYKAHSKKEKIAFYVYLSRSKKGKEYFCDTYVGFLERRKQVKKVIGKTEELLGDVKEGASLIEYDGSEKIECDKKDLNRVMADVSKSEKGYYESAYYYSGADSQELCLTYKTTLNFEEFKGKKYTELYLIYKMLKTERKLYDKGEYDYMTEIKVVIETSDGCSVILKGDSDYIYKEYVDSKEGEKVKETLKFSEEGIIVDEYKKEEGTSSITGEELQERAKYNKYKVITDLRYKTLSNDGGSHINVYYQIDFGDDTIIKYEDKYVGFKGYEYKQKKLYEKTLNRNTSSVLKKTLDDLITKKDINEENNYSPYVIESVNKEIKIYNKESIKKLENMLDIIDSE